MVMVEPDDVRPARDDGTCFYCRRPLGSPHKDDCVIVCRWVDVTVTLKLRTEIPAYQSKEQAEFAWNEGIWCVDNLVHALASIEDDVDCFCGSADLRVDGEMSADTHHGTNASVWIRR